MARIVAIGMIGVAAAWPCASAAAAPIGVEGGAFLNVFAQDSRPVGHTVTLSFAGGSYVVADPRGVQAFEGCASVDPTHASCPSTGSEGADVELGDGDDLVRLRSVAPGEVARVTSNGGDDELIGSPARDQLLGGDGDDRLAGRGGDDGLYGDDGRDRIKGGGGTDTMFGGDGADVLLARDGTRDRRIACQGGRARDERASTDGQDPKPGSC